MRWGRSSVNIRIRLLSWVNLSIISLGLNSLKKTKKDKNLSAIIIMIFVVINREVGIECCSLIVCLIWIITPYAQLSVGDTWMGVKLTFRLEHLSPSFTTMNKFSLIMHGSILLVIIPSGNPRDRSSPSAPGVGNCLKRSCSWEAGVGGGANKKYLFFSLFLRSTCYFSRGLHDGCILQDYAYF